MKTHLHMSKYVLGIIMRAIELELYKHALLAFSAIESIHYKPEQRVQIIIGSNGSGKSTLLSELNPLPTERKFMGDGGFKRFYTEHKGVFYTLYYKYSKTNVKCSFIEHRPESVDVELNEGGTAAAQKILIEKIFGLDVNLLKLWLGKTKFTALAPVKRRDWILKLSGSDLDYAMTIFNRAKQETNDARSVEKHYIKRLANEIDDKASVVDVEALEDRVATLTTNINRLMEQRDTRIANTASIKFNLDNLLDEFYRCTTSYFETIVVRPRHVPPCVRDNSSLYEYAVALKTQIEQRRLDIENLYEQQALHNAAIQAGVVNGVGSLNDLVKINEDLTQQLNELLRTTTIYAEYDNNTNFQEVSGVYAACKPTLIDILSMMGDNSNGRYAVENGNTAISKIRAFTDRIASMTQRKDQLHYAIDHYNHTTDVNCPKCNHGFKPGFADMNPTEMQNEINQLADDIAKCKERLAYCESFLEEYNQYNTHVSMIRELFKNNRSLVVLFKMLRDDGLYSKPPISHMPILMEFEQMLYNCIAIDTLKQDIQSNQAIIDGIKAAKLDQQSYTQSFEATLSNRINDTINRITFEESVLREVEVYGRAIKKRNELHARVNEIVVEMETLLTDYLLSLANKEIANRLSIEQVTLAQTTTTLNNVMRQDAVINEVRVEKEKATHNLRVYSAVMEALSPTEGLISKYIQGFLDVFIEDVNLVINEIWTTPLEVMSCAVGSSEVNCKFPLSVNDGHCLSDDISEASDGQVDIINFAFRIALAQYLDLQDYPLYVDELAPTLDEQHRINVIRYLTDLMENNQFEQMFMVSHYASNHYAFSNADVLMLDGRNIIEKPASYNTNVVIKYNENLIKK